MSYYFCGSFQLYLTCGPYKNRWQARLGLRTVVCWPVACCCCCCSSINGIFQARVLEWGASGLEGNILWRLENQLYYLITQGFPAGTGVKNLPANVGDTRDAGSILGLGIFPGKGKATHFRILAWKILWTEEPGGLQYMVSQRVRNDWATKHTHRNLLILTHLKILSILVGWLIFGGFFNGWSLFSGNILWKKHVIWRKCHTKN